VGTIFGMPASKIWEGKKIVKKFCAVQSVSSLLRRKGRFMNNLFPVSSESFTLEVLEGLADDVI